MTSKTAVDSFVSSKRIAIVGASKSGKKFGNIAAKELAKKGYELAFVHPGAESIDGHPAYGSFAELDTPVDAALVVVPPDKTLGVVESAHEAGIDRIWMQQGAESDEAIAYCREHDISAVHGECILMFAQPAGFHGFHWWVWDLIGKTPKE